MKKSLLLLSLLVSVNIFSANPSIPQSELDELEIQPTSQGPYSKAGETSADYMNTYGGSLPLVAAHQTAEHKHLHKAVAGKHGKQHAVKVTSRQTRAERKAERRAERQAAGRAKHSAKHATHVTTHVK